MFARYREVLTHPGAWKFSAAGLLARAPMSMVSIGTLLLVEHTTGSYAVAGAVAATLGVATAVAGPVLSRLVDRHGQRRVLLPAVVVQALGLIGLVVAGLASAPVWAYVIAALVAGAGTVSIGALVRARWAHLLAGTGQLGSAFALESVLDELVFILGPVLVVGVATAVHPAAGLSVAVALLLAGTAVLAAQRSSEPPPAPRRAAGQPPAAGVMSPALLVIMAVLFLAAGVFGSVEVVVVAFADERGVEALAGPLIAALAAGSMLSGLVYGAVTWRSPLRRRLVVALAMLAGGVCLIPLADGMGSMAVVLLITGVAIAPMLIVALSIAQEVVPPGRVTEGLTWATLAINLSYSGSTALAGAVVSSGGWSAATLVPIASGVAALLVGLATSRWLPGPDRG